MSGFQKVSTKLTYLVRQYDHRLPLTLLATWLLELTSGAVVTIPAAGAE